MTQLQQYDKAPPFCDPKNINYGSARVIWAPGDKAHAPGWVLPGGRRTADKAKAMLCAHAMDALIDPRR